MVEMVNLQVSLVYESSSNTKKDLNVYLCCTFEQKDQITMVHERISGAP